MILMTDHNRLQFERPVGIFSQAIYLSSIRTSIDPRSHILTGTSRGIFGSPKTSTLRNGNRLTLKGHYYSVHHMAVE